MKKNKINFIGAHVSIGGGFFKAISRAQDAGANCLQIFTKSNRQWKAKDITKGDIENFLSKQQETGIKHVVAHASYLINLASTNQATLKKSIAALAIELQRSEMLHIPYLILHPGSAKECNSETLKNVANNIDEAFAQSKTKKVSLLLETMAGQGNSLGSTFEELAEIIEHAKTKKRIGVCIDTCHIFAAGYSFETKSTYKELFAIIKKTVGLSKIKVIHINDSKKEKGSRVDRHENITKGKINSDAFAFLINDSALQDVLKIVETPTGDDEVAAHKKNIMILKNMIKK